MVGWSRRAIESSERAAAAAAREKSCIDSGCKCYCHAPRHHHEMRGVPTALIVLAIAWLIFTIYSVRSCQREQALHPPQPYYCTGITGTGAPADCHPAILPDDVLKKYEDHFKTDDEIKPKESPPPAADPCININGTHFCKSPEA